MKKIERFAPHICVVLCSMIAGFFLMASTKVVYNGDVFGLHTVNYMKHFHAGDLFLWLLFTAACVGAIFAVGFLYRRFGELLFSDKEQKWSSRKFFFVVSGLIFLAWVPYLLTFYPGGIYSDSLVSLYQVLNSVFSNRHPLLFTFGVGVFVLPGKAIFGSLAGGTMTYTVAQTIAMALVMGYFVTWMRKKGIRPLVYIAAAVFIALFPLYPFYAIAMWKDTPFSLALLLYTLYLVDIIQSDGEKIENLPGVIKYLVLTFFVCFYRNNGIYIALLVHVMLSLVYWKRMLTALKQFQALSVLCIVCYFILYGPVYSALNLSTDPVESLGVPNQQIFAVFSDENGKYTEEEAEFLSNIWDLEEIPTMYAPLLGDVPKWNMAFFDEDYLDSHLPEYFKTWFTLCTKNFEIYVRAWLMETLTFWSPIHSGWEAYIQPGVWPNDYGLVQYNLLEDKFGFDFEELVQPDTYIAPGLLFWVAMLFSGTAFFIAPKGKRLKAFLPMLPLLGLWITVMIATPIAISLRYAYMVVMVIPLNPIYPMLFARKE